MSVLYWCPQSWTQHCRGVSQSGAEGENPPLALLPTLRWVQPSTRVAFWAASARCWLTGSFPPPSPLQVLLLGAALQPLLAQPGFVLGIAPTRGQDLALGLVELREVGTSHLSSASVVAVLTF